MCEHRTYLPSSKKASFLSVQKSFGSKIAIPTLVFGSQNPGEKKGHSFVPRTLRLGRQMLQKNGRIPFQNPLWRGTGYPAQTQRLGGLSLEDSPVSYGPARSFTGGWWLLMTN